MHPSFENKRGNSFSANFVKIFGAMPLAAYALPCAEQARVKFPIVFMVSFRRRCYTLRPWPGWRNW